MGLQLCFWVGVFLFSSSLNAIFCDQEGFLSLSCGGATNFVDSLNITWVSDSEYIGNGNTTTVDCIESMPSLPSGFPVRFFPDSEGRHCYRLPLKNAPSSPVLVRIQFVYKNYDGRGKPPAFSVSISTAMATKIDLKESDPWVEEFIWPINKEILPVCFQSLPDGGYPVVSSIEVRPLPLGAYSSGIDGYRNKLLRKRYRINCGYTNGSLRYPSDPHDRLWDADEDFGPSHLSAAFMAQFSFNLSSIMESPPMSLLQTARILARKSLLTYDLPLDKLGDYYIVLYFAGFLLESPTFNVLINGNVVRSNYTVNCREESVIYFTQVATSRLNISFETVSFCPQINAIEVYELVDIPAETSSTTVSALQIVQQFTGLNLGWQDDPCFPTPWTHIECEGSLVTSLELSDINLRSISPTIGDLMDLKTLDLHNTSLYGEIENLGGLLHLQKLNLSFNNLSSIGSDLAYLTSLQVLDLQHNSLQGLVPESLGDLKDLHLLNLENNKLQGPLPQSLNRDSLLVRTSGNLCLSFSATTCYNGSSNPYIEPPQFTIFSRRKHTARKHIAIMIVATAGGIFVIVLISILVFLYIRRKGKELSHTARTKIEMRNWNGSAKVFSYREIKSATNCFKQKIGHGSFGSVYIGKLSDGKMVAVKVRFDKTQLGADSFINEVRLLSKIRHQNLVSFEGFCHESKQQILVYEYLPGGSLADNLYGSGSKNCTLSWIRRLKIAVDAAKGLDYLHNGSEPRIIHRDVKCSNILLDAEMNAKVCDFGLSKQVTRADATHITTVVKGTAGYIDPEYYSTQQLTEKSDVYSFGVVLLELICGREPLTRSGTPDTFNLVLWAKPYLQAGVFEVVDVSIQGTFNVESMRKTAFSASRCVERDASLRPTIAEVLRDLKEAYSIQLSYLEATGGGY
ncbi:hypothetical protein Nepgr_029765 [Nepenthes gracilis]|uniref:non-specific serine/threonine protein kinase n=1 Tax=Nepenthes gracilis TaxID=150966 RepID=A0AAD3TEJ0_NEPGR|nr:hypothetical protein Nepgr_029765 [Nepenthes gracilis]